LGSAFRAVLVLAWICSASCDGSSSDAPSGADGLYLGTDVSFRVVGGVAADFRFSHIECRVAHPENQDVALCLLRPNGQPEDTLPLSGPVLDGDVGEIYILGEINDGTALGTWRYESTCFDGSVCQSEGQWTADWTEEPGGTEPLQPIDGPDPRSPVGDGSSTGAPDPGDDTDDSRTNRGVPGEPACGASEPQLTAWEAFEAVRLQAGIAMPAQGDGLNAAAQAHADYFSLHVESYQEAGLNPHQENPDWEEGFTGTGIGDRLTYHDAKGGSGWGEVMAFSGSAEGAVSGWMDTLYHRVPFVHPNTYKWGFGIASGGANCEVMDYTVGPAMAQGATTWSATGLSPDGTERGQSTGQLGVPWPPPGATDVDTSWSGNESPQPPLPATESYPSGPVITLTFASGTGPALDTATLTGPSGLIPAQVQSPDNDPLLSSTWSLYAHDPLAPGAPHTVHVTGEVGGEPFDASWTFTTR